MNYSNESETKVINILKEFVSAQVEFYAMKMDAEAFKSKINSVSTSFNDALGEISASNIRNNYVLLFFFLCKKFKSTLENEYDNKNVIISIYESFEKNLRQIVEEGSVSSKSSISPNYRLSNSAYTKHEYNHHMKRNKRSNFPKHISRVLKDWLIENAESPYPTESEKQILSEATGLDHTQINNWFINARRRILPILRNKK